MFTKILLEETDSTNDHAKRLVRDGTINEATVICAERQSAGRGSRGRSWLSFEGNLLASFVFEPSCSDNSLHLLVYALSLATLDCVKAVSPEQDVQIKWPNDILLNGLKVSGSLHEIEKGPTRTFFIAGIGINVAHAPSGDVLYRATSLADQNCDIKSVEEHLDALSRRISARLSEFATKPFTEIRDEVVESIYGLNQMFSVSTTGERDNAYRGVFLGIDDDGRLLLRKQSGEILKLSTGTIFSDLEA